ACSSWEFMRCPACPSGVSSPGNARLQPGRAISHTRKGEIDMKTTVTRKKIRCFFSSSTNMEIPTPYGQAGAWRSQEGRAWLEERLGNVSVPRRFWKNLFG